MRRPTWTGTATPVSRPGSQARKIFVFDSIVVVRNPGETLSPANAPPRSSANAASAPPCTWPLLFRWRSSASSSPTSLSLSASIMRMPKCPGIPERVGLEVIDEHQFAARIADHLNSNRKRHGVVDISLAFRCASRGQRPNSDSRCRAGIRIGWQRRLRVATMPSALLDQPFAWMVAWVGKLDVNAVLLGFAVIAAARRD